MLLKYAEERSPWCLICSKLPYDVTPEQALSHDEVRTRLDASIRNMRSVTDKFLSAIVSSLDKIPWVWRTTVLPLRSWRLRACSSLTCPFLSLEVTECDSLPRYWKTPCMRSFLMLARMSFWRWASEQPGEWLSVKLAVTSTSHSCSLGVCVERSTYVNLIYLLLWIDSISRWAFLIVSFV